MKQDEIVLGQILQLKANPEIVGQARKISKKGNVAIMVLGNIRWYKPEELEPHYG